MIAINKYKIILLSTAIFLFVKVSAQRWEGQPLIITVSGNPSFPTSGLVITDAGNDFTDNSILSTSQSYLSIYPSDSWENYFKNFRYRVTVYKSDLHMHPSLTIEIKRDGNGTGLDYAKVYNGNNWQTVTNTPQYFFDGKGDRYNIEIGYRMNNVSVLIPADSYESTIIFTVYED